MDHCTCHCAPPRRSLLPEALIALVALLGFALAWGLGYDITWNDLWVYTAMLGIIVAFYFLLLLCRAIFIFMTGGDSFWWEKFAQEQKQREKKK